MKVIFFGTSVFSRKVLEIIFSYRESKGFEIVFVVTTPDKPQGRGWKILPSPVKSFCQKVNLLYSCPSDLDTPSVYERIKEIGGDIFVVVDYGKIIPKRIFELAKVIPLGIHPSLLPKYRGPSPIRTVLLKGEKYTGVTVFKLTEKIDSGPILVQKTIPINEDDDYFSLFDKLVKTSGESFLEALDMVKEGDIELLPQDEAEATYTHKFKKEDGRINWYSSAPDIVNLIRAFKVWPFAYTFYKGKLIQITQAEVEEKEVKDSFSPSQIVNISKDSIDVLTSCGIVKIRRLKPEGKKEMSACSFVCGYRIKVGERFE